MSKCNLVSKCVLMSVCVLKRVFMSMKVSGGESAFECVFCRTCELASESF